MNDKVRNAGRTDREWMDLIQEYRTSQLCDKAWCEQHGIPVSTFYTKITRLRKKACDVPVAHHHVIQESQQVVPLAIMDDIPEPFQDAPSTATNLPSVILKINDYRVEISNHAARDTILNTLSVLRKKEKYNQSLTF